MGKRRHVLVLQTHSFSFENLNPEGGLFGPFCIDDLSHTTRRTYSSRKRLKCQIKAEVRRKDHQYCRSNQENHRQFVLCTKDLNSFLLRRQSVLYARIQMVSLLSCSPE